MFSAGFKLFDGITESFLTKKGLRQGDALFCLLFNLGIQERHADHVAPSIRTSWQSLRQQAAVARSV
jgi:hypothetical protein